MLTPCTFPYRTVPQECWRQEYWFSSLLTCRAKLFQQCLSRKDRSPSDGETFRIHSLHFRIETNTRVDIRDDVIYDNTILENHLCYISDQIDAHVSKSTSLWI
jgi:hypothetical protein